MTTSTVPQASPIPSTPAAPAPATSGRLGRFFERRGSVDLPFYDGDPLTLATWQWLVVVISVVVGFLALTLIPASNNVQALVPRTLFAAIPLATFIAFTGHWWTKLFQRFTWRDAGAAVFFAIATTAASGAVGIAVKAVFGANANGATDGLVAGGPIDLIAFYAGTGIQLVGEELFTILPLLALVTWLCTKAGLSRNTAIVIAWLVTAVWFGAAHLPTYGWNFAQAILIIGSARLVLSLAYLRTKNLGVSIGAHIINDWAQFTLIILLSAGGAAAGTALL